MNRSLRVSVILFVTLANLAVFGAGFVWLTGSLSRYRRSQEEEFKNLLVERLQNLIDSQSIQASGILRWSYWQEFADAVVVHLPQPTTTELVVPARPPRLDSQPRRSSETPDPYGALPYTELPLALEELGAPAAPPTASDRPAPEQMATTPAQTAAVESSEAATAVVASRVTRGPERHRGVILHPLGSKQRGSDFDREGILSEIESAVAEDRARPAHGGAAVPIHDPRGRAWGGCWFKLRPRWTLGTLTRQLLPWFFLSTFFLTLGTFFVLQRLVLEPVEMLARGSRNLASGDRTVQLPETGRRDEIAELVRAFNRMAGDVRNSSERLAQEVELATEKARRAEAAAMMQRRLAATGELAAGIAHEINNPLGGMINAVEVLGRSELEPSKRRLYLELLENGLERIRTTVGQVLRLAPRTSRVEPLSIAGPIGDAIGLLRHRIQREGVQLEVESRGVVRNLHSPQALQVLDGLPPVRGSANELGQVVLNILANSLDAIALLTPQERQRRGRVRIAVDPLGRELALTFQDDGPGISAAELARAADPFFTTKASGRGTGLGLAIVHNVISSHGGRTHLSSQLGTGFRVEVFLPIYQRDERVQG